MNFEQPIHFEQPMNFEQLSTNGIHVRAVVEGEGPVVIFVHGFPESWYSWRHQIEPVVRAGFKVVVPDVRGYGGSDKPDAIEAYDMENMTADVVGLIDAMGVEKAVLVGHDWGAPIVWNTTALYPERVQSVVALSVPFRRRGEVPAIDLWRKLYKDRFFYQVYFQNPGIAEAELEADVRTALRKLYFAGSGDGGNAWLQTKAVDASLLDGLVDPSPFPSWMSDVDLEYYASQFERSGFRGPINRYRNQVRDWKRFPQLGDVTIGQPALFIAGTEELVFKFVPGIDPLEAMVAAVPNLDPVDLIEGGGHWIQQERVEAVNRQLIGFLERQHPALLTSA